VATTDYDQTDTAQVCGLNEAACVGLGGTVEVGKQAEIGVGLGSTEFTASVAANADRQQELSFEIIIPSDVINPTDTDDIVLNLNFTTGHMDVTLENAFICRINSSCANQETIVSEASLGVPTDSGLQAVTLPFVNSVTFAAGDKAILRLAFSNSGSMFTRTVGITPNQVLELPFNQPAPTATLQSSTLLLTGVGR